MKIQAHIGSDWLEVGIRAGSDYFRLWGFPETDNPTEVYIYCGRRECGRSADLKAFSAFSESRLPSCLAASPGFFARAMAAALSELKRLGISSIWIEPSDSRRRCVYLRMLSRAGLDPQYIPAKSGIVCQL